MTYALGLSACTAVADILFAVLSHLRPIELATDHLNGLASILVSSRGKVVVQSSDFQLEGDIVGDVEGVYESHLSLVVDALGQTDLLDGGGAVF